VGFETMIPVFEWPKTVHASDCLATGTGNWHTWKVKFHHVKNIKILPIILDISHAYKF
jgi:hypothetical protein